MPVISSIVFTKKDISGNNWAEAWVLFEFRNAYVPGGENIDLTPFFQRTEVILAQPISGALYYDPRPNAADIPGNPGSGRIALFYLASGVIVASGVGISISSGTLLTTSGAAGVQSGFAVVATLHSGSIAAQLNINAGVAMTELLSGAATSGARAYLHALGY